MDILSKKILFNFVMIFFSIVLIFALPQSISCAEQNISQNLVPIPVQEQALATEFANEWIIAAPINDVLEGAIFDQFGNLLFCDVTARKVMQLTPDKKLSTLLELPDIGVGGLAFHKDGRLFMAALDLQKRKGGILAWSPDTKIIETIIPFEKGYWPNDLVFNDDGGFYFSDFRGSVSNPEGGVYYVSPDFKTITPVIPNLAQANGVAISPDGKTLWATEFAKNRLHRAQLIDNINISPTGSAIPYYFTGPAPDSMRVDKAGNVYVAIYGQGRVLVFNNQGLPIGQILLPGREIGQNLLSTSLAIQPNADHVYIVSSNVEKDYGAKIFKATSLAPGQAPQK